MKGNESVATHRLLAGLDRRSPLRRVGGWGALFWFSIINLRTPAAVAFVLVLIGAIIWFRQYCL